MTASATQAVITSGLADFGGSVLVILTAVIGVGIAYIVFDFGYKTIIQGRTSFLSSKLLFLDHVPFVKPYKNYNRLRSKKWNIEHTM